jgi:hypothetical protein
MWVAAAKRTCSKPESDVIDCRLSWEAVDEIRQAKERKAFYRDMAEAQEEQERAEVEAAAELELRRRRLEQELTIPPSAADEKAAQAAAAAESAAEQTDDKDGADRARRLMEDEMPCKCAPFPFSTSSPPLTLHSTRGAVVSPIDRVLAATHTVVVSTWSRRLAAGGVLRARVWAAPRQKTKHPRAL